MPTSVQFYVRAWVAVGVATAAGALLVFRPSPEALGDGTSGALAAVLFVTLVGLAEALELRLVRGSSVKAFTLVEAAVVPALLLFPPGWALLIVLAGVAAGQLARHRSAFQLAFNLGQFAFAGSVAVTVTYLLRGGAPALAMRSVGAVSVGILMFGAVNVLAVAGVVARLEQRPMFALVREETRLSALNLASNACLGVIVALVWVHQPQLLPLVGAPAFAVHLAYRGLLRSDQLLSEVRAQNVRLDRVVQGATDGIVLLDDHGSVEIWNPTMTALTGLEVSEVIGTRLDQVLEVSRPEGPPVDPLDVVRRARPDEPVHVQELVLNHRDGGGHRVSITHGFLFDDDGRLLGDVMLLRDVTREREVEHLKDDFVARVTHELRTPLTPIRGFAESIIAREDQLDAQTRRMMLSRILERTDHMIRLIDDLLLVPQLSGTGARRELEVVVPGKLVASVERSAAQLDAPAPDVEIIADVDLPDVVVELQWLDMIMDKLLSNAAKYSPEGSPIEVRIAKSDQRVEIAVRDEGRGISAGQLERIFDLFHRTEEPLTMETGGMGVGLYVARRLARQMGGDLRVESRLGHGSTFRLQLVPARPEARSAQTSSNQSGSSAT